MNSTERLELQLSGNDGILRTSEAIANGITKEQLYRFIKNKGLEKYAHGVYIDADSFPDEMYLLQLQFPRAVYSHETALYLYDLLEREPSPFTVTVPSSYNSSGLKEKGIQVFYTKNDWYSLGLSSVKSLNGHNLQVYDLERTICDIVKRSDEMDVAAFNYAINQYVKRKDKDYARLSAYAVTLRMEKKLREKIGVLF